MSSLLSFCLSFILLLVNFNWTNSQPTSLQFVGQYRRGHIQASEQRTHLNLEFVKRTDLFRTNATQLKNIQLHPSGSNCFPQYPTQPYLPINNGFIPVISGKEAMQFHARGNAHFQGTGIASYPTSKQYPQFYNKSFGFGTDITCGFSQRYKHCSACYSRPNHCRCVHFYNGCKSNHKSYNQLPINCHNWSAIKPQIPHGTKSCSDPSILPKNTNIGCNKGKQILTPFVTPQKLKTRVGDPVLFDGSFEEKCNSTFVNAQSNIVPQQRNIQSTSDSLIQPGCMRSRGQFCSENMSCPNKASAFEAFQYASTATNSTRPTLTQQGRQAAHSKCQLTRALKTNAKNNNSKPNATQGLKLRCREINGVPIFCDCNIDGASNRIRPNQLKQLLEFPSSSNSWPKNELMPIPQFNAESEQYMITTDNNILETQSIKCGLNRSVSDR